VANQRNFKIRARYKEMYHLITLLWLPGNEIRLLLLQTILIIMIMMVIMSTWMLAADDADADDEEEEYEGK